MPILGSRNRSVRVAIESAENFARAHAHGTTVQVAHEEAQKALQVQQARGRLAANRRQHLTEQQDVCFRLPKKIGDFGQLRDRYHPAVGILEGSEHNTKVTHRLLGEALEHPPPHALLRRNCSLREG